jgi:hypothetical protein
MMKYQGTRRLIPGTTRAARIQRLDFPMEKRLIAYAAGTPSTSETAVDETPMIRLFTM